MKNSERNTQDEQLSTETKGKPLILSGELKDGHEDQNSDNEMANSAPQIEAAKWKVTEIT